MFKYLWQAHKALITAILLDLIILAAVILISIATGMQTKFLSYHSLYDALGTNLATFVFYSIYQIIVLIQFPFILAITGYLFTGSRYINLLKVVGKNNTIFFQALVLFITLGIGLGLQLWESTLLPPYYFINYPNTMMWLIFSGLLVSYHLLFHSNLRYSSLIIKAAVPLFTAIFIYSIMSLFGALQALLSLNSYTLPTLAADLTSINQVWLPAITPNTTIIFYFIVYTLIISLISLVELKKVGR